MVDYVPVEKGVTIRQPSTANLMLDSKDRDTAIYTTAGDFQITKTNSLLNGYFTRIATSEVVLEWQVPNINATNNTMSGTVDPAGGPAVPFSITIDPGLYTVASLLDQITVQLQGQAGITGVYNPQIIASTTTNFGLANQNTQQVVPPSMVLVDGGGNYIDWTIAPGVLQALLGWNLVSDAFKIAPTSTDIRLYRYIDFTSQQLTYAQDLKDASTNTQNKNVLNRWYLAWDNAPAFDYYGYPVFMGYTEFQLRRIYNPPKQIRWEPNLPIGNLAFQVYVMDINQNYVLLATTDFEWLMTLQVSEV
jgi:hypothetical protein